MRLELGNIRIEDVQFGSNTEVKNHTLYVNKEELIALLSEDERLASVSIELARPGESVRIMPVKDVIEPRVKVEGPGGLFPGFISKLDQVGSGRTHVLKGAAVVTAGKVVGFQEGIIDMTGPAADYTPFAHTNNIVIVANPVEGLEQHGHEAALRIMGFKAATYIAEAGRNVEPDEVKTYEVAPLFENVAKYPNLPKVVYVYMLQSQGLLHDTYYYGIDVKQMVPTLMYPTEIMDGAIVSGNCVSACDKNTTFHHLNSPVIYDLMEKHGKEICFLGCVVTNENVTLGDKQRSSNMVAKLVEFLGADGAVISEEGFGNPDADLIMNCTKVEKKGVKTVLVTDEYAGRDGASQSLADADKLADAVITAGNANEVVTLPPMKKLIGYAEPADTIAGGFDGSLKADGSITVEIQAITGATNELGFNKLTARGY
ncbi:glycine/sarcosine/betaine reductase component B subunit [Clostridium sp. 'deep sea']|uniref:glycine/sarcosine/betaine reductase component B subunit n=1 Tax=Clostridium sp. 'deep sea' TaxID=2779445 RepID=UPI0018969D4C|nr:glycine/sarcosine/betaine reductase component B subunit [Clostridium sp. 'deep sea']QOR34318.1 glycine/sarcosine/betaine reductase component B subunit [Clostridium sp. 'deep sea']